MANAPISSNTAGVNNALLTVFEKRAVSAPRIRGNPLKMITDVSDAFITYGQTVVVNVAPTITSSLLTDGSQRVLNDSAPSQVSITVNRNRYTAADITDVLNAFVQGSSFVDALIDGQIAALENDTQSDIMSQITGNFTTNVAGSYATPITEANIVALRASIINQKPPPGYLNGLMAPTAGAFAAFSVLENVIRANQRGYMEASPSINATPRYGQDVIYNNISVSECQAVPNNGGSVDNFIFHKNALAMAMRPLPIPMEDGTGVKARLVVAPEIGMAYTMQMSYNFLNYAPELSVRCLYGMNVLKEVWGGILKSN